MKILFVTDYYLPHIGGVEKLFSTLAQQLVEKGHKITFVTWKHDKKLPQKETINGVSVVRISSPARMLFSIFGFLKILKLAEKHDFIHTSTYGAAIGASLAGKRTRKKVILTVHEFWGKRWFKMPFISLIQKLAFYASEQFLYLLPFHHFIAVSDSTKSDLLKKGISQQNISRIYNGLDYNLPEWKRTNDKKPFRFIYFGRAGISKGIDLILETIPTFFAQNPSAELVMVVASQPKKIYQHIVKTIHRSPYKEQITLLSNLKYETLLNELLSSNCVLIPSHYEGFGFTAAEASAMKIPIIASNKGSLPEVVSGQALIFENQSTKALNEAMDKAILGKFETIDLKKFPIEDFIQNHILLYQFIMQ